MKFLIDVAIILALLLLGFFLYVQYGTGLTARLRGSDTKATIYIDRVAFSLQVATTESDKERGLSGQTDLDQYGGMIFIFPTPAKYGFWMKEMNFPIDILWFDDALTLIHIEKNVSPASYPTVFAPRQEARYVVELNANMVDRVGLTLGDKMTIPPELETKAK